MKEMVKIFTVMAGIFIFAAVVIIGLERTKTENQPINKPIISVDEISSDHTEDITFSVEDDSIPGGRIDCILRGHELEITKTRFSSAIDVDSSTTTKTVIVSENDIDTIHSILRDCKTDKRMEDIIYRTLSSSMDTGVFDSQYLIELMSGNNNESPTVTTENIFTEQMYVYDKNDEYYGRTIHYIVSRNIETEELILTVYLDENDNTSLTISDEEYMKLREMQDRTLYSNIESFEKQMFYKGLDIIKTGKLCFS